MGRLLKGRGSQKTCLALGGVTFVDRGSPADLWIKKGNPGSILFGSGFFIADPGLNISAIWGGRKDEKTTFGNFYDSGSFCFFRMGSGG
jgi:hypothetical protein